MTHTITVTPGDGSAAGWIIHMWKMPNGVQRSPKPLPVTLTPDGDGAFTGDLDLNNGVYAVDCDLMTDASVAIDLSPKEPIIQPRGATWPLTAKLSGTATGDIQSWYFRVGAAEMAAKEAGRPRAAKR